jgi:hypothetical protein
MVALPITVGCSTLNLRIIFKLRDGWIHFGLSTVCYHLDPPLDQLLHCPPLHHSRRFGIEELLTQPSSPYQIVNDRFELLYSTPYYRPVNPCSLKKSFLMQVLMGQEFASNSAAAVCPKLLVVKNLERTFPFRLLLHRQRKTLQDYNLPIPEQESTPYHLHIQYTNHLRQSKHHNNPYPVQNRMQPP